MSELVGAVLTRPVVDEVAVAALLRDRWAIDGRLRPLPSERDRNFAVEIDGQPAFVLKVSNVAEDVALLQMQHAAMSVLAAARVPCQRPMETIAGEDIVTWTPSGGREVLVRLLTWLPGRPLATVPPADRPPALLGDLGATMGRAAQALTRFDHPAARRPFQWDARRGLEIIDAHLPAVRDPARAALIGRWRSRLDRLGAILPTLRTSIIHNDANDHNVLVAEDHQRVSGLLDLGDAVWSITVNELAVAAAYAALDAADPIAVIDQVRAGFERELGLTDAERSMVVELVALRLSTSVALSAHQARLAPDDPYLTISEAPAWALLDVLAATEPPA
ncbi:MAG TPA: phosphotransferase [Candidatus Limnocylindrales bacterium]